MTLRPTVKIKVDGDFHQMRSYPFDSYFAADSDEEKKLIDHRREHIGTSYYNEELCNQGEWEIKDNQLWLTKNPHPTYLKDLVAPTLASWFTGELEIPGNLLTNNSDEALSSITIIPFVNGIVSGPRIVKDAAEVWKEFIKEHNQMMWEATRKNKTPSKFSLKSWAKSLFAR